MSRPTQEQYEKLAKMYNIVNIETILHISSRAIHAFADEIYDMALGDAAKVGNEYEPECCGNEDDGGVDHPPCCCGKYEPRDKTLEEAIAAIEQLKEKKS